MVACRAGGFSREYPCVIEVARPFGFLRGEPRWCQGRQGPGDRTGRFTPLPGANPAVGAVDSPEEVPEIRIEAIYPRSRRAAVVEAALSVHPYETPAFMTFPVDGNWAP